MFSSIDLHCDTLLTALLQERPSLAELDGNLDLAKLVAARAKAQFFAIFLPSPTMQTQPPYCQYNDESYTEQLYTILQQTLAEQPTQIALATNAAELEQNERQGLISAFLSFEDGRILQNDLARLDKYYAQGFRLITLLWNHANCLGYPNSDDPSVMQLGLTEFGREVVLRMADLGMLVDVSHLSDGGFYDVARLSPGPFLASHSNCRDLSPHKRNLSDPMLRLLGEKGGCCGLNFASAFLRPDAQNGPSSIEQLVEHICHMIKVGGSDLPALGTDFDGAHISVPIDSPDKMPLLYSALEKKGLSASQIEKIASGNALRLIKEVL